MKKVLVVSLTKFYGGGESFITSHLNDIEGIDFYYLIASKQLYEQLPYSRKILFTQMDFFSVVKNINKFVIDNHIDSVILNGGRSLFLAPFIYRHSVCVGIRHTLNASINGSIIYRGIYIVALNSCYCFMRKVVHVSQKSKSEQFFARKKTLVIYNGVSVKKKLTRKVAAKNFLFVGRMTKEKGVDKLIEAFNEICKIDNSVHLYLVGNGEVDSVYPHSDNIHFEGFSTELENYYLNADWYISLTSRENCSISVIDAFSYGIPVITTDVGGNTELVQDGVNGFIIDQTKNAVISLYVSKIKSLSEEQKQSFSKFAIYSFEKNFNLNNQKKVYKELLEIL